MINKQLRTLLSLLLVSTLLLTTMFVSPAVSCAANNDGQIETPVVAPRAITKEEIYRYGKGKGRNASRIPVLTYHRILADSIKASPEYANDRYAIAVSEFTKQMQWLRKRKQSRHILSHSMLMADIFQTSGMINWVRQLRRRISLRKRSLLVALSRLSL